MRKKSFIFERTTIERQWDGPAVVHCILWFANELMCAKHQQQKIGSKHFFLCGLCIYVNVAFWDTNKLTYVLLFSTWSLPYFIAFIYSVRISFVFCFIFFVWLAFGYCFLAPIKPGTAHGLGRSLLIVSFRFYFYLLPKYWRTCAIFLFNFPSPFSLCSLTDDRVKGNRGA